METQPIRFITIPFSHFCEKARWALSRSGIPFREEGHLPLLHMLALKRAGGEGDEVPAIVTREGLLDDSTRILKWLDERVEPKRRLYPDDPKLRAEVEEWEDLFDEKLGVVVRVWAYGKLMTSPRAVKKLASQGVPGWQAALLPVAFPPLKALILKAYKVTPANVERAEKKIDEIFARVSAHLTGGGTSPAADAPPLHGRRYLVGDRFTAADLAFAALAGPILMVEIPGFETLRLEDLPPEAAAKARAWRETPAGKHALRLYAEVR